MRIGLTGASGLIGKRLVELSDEEDSLVCLGRSASSIFSEGIDYFQTDYSIESLTRALKNCDVVINLAAAKVDVNRAQSIALHLDSIKVAENVVLAAINLGIPRLIQASSRCVYSTALPLPFIEDAHVSPINHYGIAKVTVEQLMQYHNRLKSIDCYSLRFSQVVGHRLSDGGIVAAFLRKALHGDEINLFGNSRERRDYLYVDDAVSYLSHFARSPITPGIYNAGSGASVSIAELADLVVKNTGSSSRILMSEPKPILNDVVMDMTKTVSTGIGPRYEISEMINDIVRRSTTDWRRLR